MTLPMQKLRQYGLPLLLFVSGCASSAAVREVKNDTAQLKSQVAAIREDQRRIVQALFKLQKLLEQSNEISRQLTAEIKLELDRLNRQSRLLSDRLEDTGQRIARLPDRLQAGTSGPGTAVSAARDSLRPNPGGTVENARSLYETAYQDLIKGQYQLAEAGFRRFLQLFPAAALSDNAQYWIGECFYAQRKFREAKKAFLVVLERYPKGDKVPAALLKLGYSELALGDKSKALKTLQELVRRYPFSKEAKLAQEKIEDTRK